jgi:transposase
MSIRPLSPAEQRGLQAGLRSSEAFTLRRSQILLASHRGQRPSEIACNLGCATQTVRNTLHAFEEEGLSCLKQQSSRPKTIHAEFDQAKCEALRAVLHQSPRTRARTRELGASVLGNLSHAFWDRSHNLDICERAFGLRRSRSVGWPKPISSIFCAQPP